MSESVEVEAANRAFPWQPTAKSSTHTLYWGQRLITRKVTWRHHFLLSFHFLRNRRRYWYVHSVHLVCCKGDSAALYRRLKESASWLSEVAISPTRCSWWIHLQGRQANHFIEVDSAVRYTNYNNIRNGYIRGPHGDWIRRWKRFVSGIHTPRDLCGSECSVVVRAQLIIYPFLTSTGLAFLVPASPGTLHRLVWKVGCGPVGTRCQYSSRDR